MVGGAWGQHRRCRGPDQFGDPLAQSWAPDRLIASLRPGSFTGQDDPATASPRNANVIAHQHVTCLVFSPRKRDNAPLSVLVELLGTERFGVAFPNRG